MELNVNAVRTGRGGVCLLPSDNEQSTRLKELIEPLPCKIDIHLVIEPNTKIQRYNVLSIHYDEENDEFICEAELMEEEVGQGNHPGSD